MQEVLRGNLPCYLVLLLCCHCGLHTPLPLMTLLEIVLPDLGRSLQDTQAPSLSECPFLWSKVGMMTLKGSIVVRIPLSIMIYIKHQHSAGIAAIVRTLHQTGLWCCATSPQDSLPKEILSCPYDRGGIQGSQSQDLSLFSSPR